MRKRSIGSRLKRPLILTALDRKKAGVLPEGLTPVKPRLRKKIKKHTIKTVVPAKSFSSSTPKIVKQKKIGVMTHYYDKIRVGVIKLSVTLCVGDCIAYETTEGGMYEQIVESMEVNRNPVFKAGKGKEIGLKLSRTPRVGSIVLK